MKMVYGKVGCSTLSLTTLIFLQGVLSASLPHVTEEDVRKNLITYGDDLVEGLTPPLLEAENHFNSASGRSIVAIENPYMVEIYKGHVNLKSTGIPSQLIKLNKTETEGIQKLALSFVRLLNSSKLSGETFESEGEAPQWKEVNPVIILGDGKISLRFQNMSEPEENATEMAPVHKRILWYFLTQYARNIFENKVKELKLSEKFAEFIDPPNYDVNSVTFQNFLDVLWSFMKLSVDYAETAFEGWTTSLPETAATEVEKKARSSTATLFAYEEPSPFHEFPSQEFQYRRKDIDSIFYGRGVI